MKRRWQSFHRKETSLAANHPPEQPTRRQSIRQRTRGKAHPRRGSDTAAKHPPETPRQSIRKRRATHPRRGSDNGGKASARDPRQSIRKRGATTAAKHPQEGSDYGGKASARTATTTKHRRETDDYGNTNIRARQTKDRVEARAGTAQVAQQRATLRERGRTTSSAPTNPLGRKMTSADANNAVRAHRQDFRP
jgi:hypothetical protein